MSETAKLEARIIPVTPFQQNTTLVWCTRTRKAAFVDPGGEVDRLMGAAAQFEVSLEAVWLTHGHLDHAGGAMAVSRATGAPIIGPHLDDDFLLSSIADQGARYGLADAESCTPTRWLADGDRLTLGDLVFDVVHCPGHTPGHVCIINKEAKLAFVGDVLFQGSIGRTDFPRGNFDDLIRSITGKLWPYGDDIRFVPGHGAMSTFGWERKCNPFVSDLALGRA
jgi:glyoxylase-like metal-dependent hydrolase (beta-lactamase superfamily II)